MDDTHPFPRRPGTLAEVLRPEEDGPGSDVATRLAGLLNEFYADDDPASQRARLEDEPAQTENDKVNAYMGAAAEHLCRRWLLGEAPRWSRGRIRFLTRPWFLGGERMRLIYLKESPSAFRRRLIFTEAEPLRRSTMPRDGRWWFYEGLRSGMRPAEGDVVPGRKMPA